MVNLVHILEVSKDVFIRIEVEYNEVDKCVSETKDISLNTIANPVVSIEIDKAIDSIFHLLGMPEIDFETVVDKVDWSSIYLAKR